MKRLVQRLHLTPEICAWLLVTALTAFVSLFRLGSLTSGLAPRESALPSLRTLVSNGWYQPIGLPLLAVQAVVRVLFHHPGAGTARLPDVLLGLLFVGVTAWLLRRWYGMRLALFGTVLIALSAWYLHSARLAGTYSLYPLAMSVILLLSSLLHQKTHSWRLLYGAAVTLALILYIPGTIWLIAALLVTERRNVTRLLSTQRIRLGGAAVLGLLALTPLIHSLLGNWHLYRVFIGFPAQWPAPLTLVRDFGSVWFKVFIHGYRQPLFNVAALPVVSALVTVTFLCGVVLYARHIRNSRTHILIALWLIATLLIALGGPVQISALLPLVFAVATGGIGYLLHEWFQVFPRNPLARNFGLGLVVVAVIFAVTYELRSYYIAWPHAPATRAAFQRKS